MIQATLSKLQCPACLSAVALVDAQMEDLGTVKDIRSGTLECTECDQCYPILGGVALMVIDVESYLVHHVKGISRFVSEDEYPDEFRDAMLEAKAELEIEHIEDDLESERVNALYLATHFLKAGGDWFKNDLIGELVQKHWDQGPFSVIQNWVAALPDQQEIVELGCGVGGLALVLGSQAKSYLGVDSSFASISLARRWIVAREREARFSIPGDLLLGVAAREVCAALNPIALGTAIDFIVADVESPAVRSGVADVCLSLNMIDMLGDPMSLPRLQAETLKPGGVAIQSSPYVWHELQARMIRSLAPKDSQDSAAAVEWMYRQAGFRIEKTEGKVPWLFFKHDRQLEIYSVHLLQGRKTKA